METSSAQDSGNININVAPSVAGQSNIGVRVAGSIDGNSGGHIKIRSGDSDTGVGGNMLLGTGANSKISGNIKFEASGSSTGDSGDLRLNTANSALSGSFVIQSGKSLRRNRRYCD